ncbi:retrovirus-related Pol polyprotein [Pseudoscourfieldia marina]
MCMHESFNGHLEVLRKVLQMLRRTGLKAHPTKCKVGGPTMQFLGHEVGGDGITPEAAKVKAISDMEPPKDAKELRSQIGLLSYYRHFIPRMSEVSEPLRKLLKKGADWAWGAHEQRAMDRLKELLCTPGVGLHHVDPARPLYLHTDWSNYGMGALLGQIDDDGNERLCGCISRSLNESEAKYPSFYGELLCVVWALRAFHVYTHGATELYVVTDHQPLKWLLDNKAAKSAHHQMAELFGSSGLCTILPKGLVGVNGRGPPLRCRAAGWLGC